MSCIWSWIPITLCSLFSAFHFIFNKRLWVKGDGSVLDKVPKWSFKELLSKDFLFHFIIIFFYIQSLKSNLACFCATEIKQGTASAPGWTERTFYFSSEGATALINHFLKQWSWSVNSIFYRRQWSTMCYYRVYALQRGEGFNPWNTQIHCICWIQRADMFSMKAFLTGNNIMIMFHKHEISWNMKSYPLAINNIDHKSTLLIS